MMKLVVTTVFLLQFLQFSGLHGAGAPATAPAQFYVGEEYLKIMALIRTVDREAYEMLLKCSLQLGGKSCVRKGTFWPKLRYERGANGTVYPILSYDFMDALSYFSPDGLNEVLSTILSERYKPEFRRLSQIHWAARNPILGLTQTKPALSETSRFALYDYLVEADAEKLKIILYLVSRADPELYDMLQECSLQLGESCIRKDYIPFVPREGFLIYRKKGANGIFYPIFLYTFPLDDLLEGPNRREYQKEFIEYLNLFYKPAFKEKDDYETKSIDSNSVLDIIAKIAPYLYQKMIEDDPSAKYNIRRADRDLASVSCSLYNGLPEIKINPLFETLPENIRTFVIGHELAHYVLGHGESNRQRYNNNKRLFPESPAGERSKQTFERTMSRVQEFEADRFAIVNLGINYLDALAFMQWDKKYYLTSLKTFDTTHPLSLDRIKQIEELGRDIESGRIRLNLMTDADWDYAIQRCLNPTLFEPMH